MISNIGSFGTHVYKIGMTRRLDPMDRIWELSDASVPFDFDVHAIIYTDDAPGLESELHQVERLQRKFAMIHSTLAQQQGGGKQEAAAGGGGGAADPRVLRESQETLNPLSLARASTASVPGAEALKASSQDVAGKAAAKLAASLDLNKSSGRLAAMR